MKRLLPPMILLASLTLGMATAHAVEPAYSTEDTTIGELLDDPKAKAVLEKLIPEFVNAERVDESRGFTLRSIQQYAPEILTDEALDKIDAELAKVPPAASAAK